MVTKRKLYIDPQRSALALLFWAMVDVLQLISPPAVEVAAELVRSAVGEPEGLGPEIAGPEEHQLVELARRVVRASGRRRPVLGVRLPGAAGRAMASGGLLPGDTARLGTVTFESWLADPAT